MKINVGLLLMEILSSDVSNNICLPSAHRHRGQFRPIKGTPKSAHSLFQKNQKGQSEPATLCVQRFRSKLTHGVFLADNEQMWLMSYVPCAEKFLRKNKIAGGAWSLLLRGGELRVTVKLSKTRTPTGATLMQHSCQL